MLDMTAVRASVDAMQKENAKVRELAQMFLIPKEGSDDSKDARKMAQGHSGAEVMVTIYSIFHGLQHPAENAMFMLLNDMTAALNTNPFWVQNVGTLMPLLIAAVNGANDARELKVMNEPKWAALEQQARCLWVELMPAIIFIVHGYAAMRFSSTEIKKAFLGLMYG